MIAIIDDDRDVRTSLAHLLRTTGFEVIEYASGDEFLSRGIHQVISCILLDLRMPGSDGLVVLTELAANGTHPPVIVVSGHGDIESAVRAMKLGAYDFIEKPYDPGDLLRAIRAAIATECNNAEHSAGADHARALVEKLPPRELDVLRGILAGKQNKAIAYELSLSIRTVETYRGRLFERLGVHGAAGAVRIAIQAGIV